MQKKKPTDKPFDAAAYRDRDALIEESLPAAAEHPNPQVLLPALGRVEA